MAVTQTLRQATMSVGGVPLTGNIVNITAPKITVKTEIHRSGGLDAGIPMDLGLEDLEMGFTLTGINTEVRQYVGQNGIAFSAIIYAAWQDVLGAVTQEIITVRGKLKEMDSGDFSPGEKQTTKYACSPIYYKSEVSGAVIHEIDILNNVRIVNGVDQLAAIRNALMTS